MATEAYKITFLCKYVEEGIGQTGVIAGGTHGVNAAVDRRKHQGITNHVTGL
jgi:hypothetical protein